MSVFTLDTRNGKVTFEMREPKGSRAAVKSDRRYATSKATAKGRQTTLARRQARMMKYGGAL